MTKQVFNILFLIVILFSTNNSIYAGGRCSGDANCSACSDCSECINCSEQGGSCGVCTNYQSTSNNYNSNQNEISNYYDSSNNINHDKKTNYSWLWLILGGFVLYLVFGKSDK
jgi:hypothetical protein